MWAPTNTYEVVLHRHDREVMDRLAPGYFASTEYYVGPRKVSAKTVDKRRARNKAARKSRRKNG